MGFSRRYLNDLQEQYHQDLIRGIQRRNQLLDELDKRYEEERGRRQRASPIYRERVILEREFENF